MIFCLNKACLCYTWTMLFENLHCKEAIMLYASMNFNVDLYCFWFCFMHTDFLSEHSGRVSVYMSKEFLLLSLHLISDSNYVSDSSPRDSVTAIFQCSIQSPELCFLSALCVNPALCLNVQHQLSALLMQLRDADKGDDCSSWLWRHVGTLDLSLHQDPLKRLWRRQGINPCWQSHRALSSGCSVTC